jgi:hypothetical protein
MIQYVFFDLQHAINCWQYGVKRLKVLQTRHPQIMPSGVQIEQVLDRFRPIAKKCDELKLDYAKERLRTFMTDLQNEQLGTYEVIENETAQVCLAMQRELWTKHFIYIPGAKENFFEQDALFGDDVTKNFPSAVPEIRAAGNCIAAEFYTAAVFHLTRATEVGLLALAAHLKIKKVGNGTAIRLAQWGDIIRSIDDCLSTQILPLAKGRRLQKKQEKLQFYQGVALEFRAIKDLWRNPVSHGVKTYDEHEVMSVFIHVKALMTRLASKIKEDP